MKLYTCYCGNPEGTPLRWPKCREAPECNKELGIPPPEPLAEGEDTLDNGLLFGTMAAVLKEQCCEQATIQTLQA